MSTSQRPRFAPDLVAALRISQTQAWQLALLLAARARDAAELAGWLEAVGLCPYEPEQGKTPWGNPRHADDPYGRRETTS